MRVNCSICPITHSGSLTCTASFWYWCPGRTERCCVGCDGSRPPSQAAWVWTQQPGIQRRANTGARGLHPPQGRSGCQCKSPAKKQVSLTPINLNARPVCKTESRISRRRLKNTTISHAVHATVVQYIWSGLLMMNLSVSEKSNLQWQTPAGNATKKIQLVKEHKKYLWT